MTMQELNHHMGLKKRLATGRELLVSLEAMATPRDGMPHTPGAREKTVDLTDEIADMKTKISELEAEITRSEAGIVEYISTISDAQTSIIFRLRFIGGMLWKEVAAAVGGISASGAKAICSRYIARGGPARMGRPKKKQG